MTCRKYFPVLSSFMTYHMIGFVNRLTRRMPLVEQDLLTLPEHLSSSPVFSVIRITRSLVLCVCSFGHCVVCSSVFWSLCCLFFCLLAIVLSVLLSFGHCVVCSSSIYEFWLTLGYRQARFTFVLVNFPFSSSNIAAAQTYGVYISQRIR